MAIVTTYICDISGKQGKKEDFVKVDVCVNDLDGWNTKEYIDVNKLVHKEVAIKLGIFKPETKEETPEIVPTFESKLATLLKDYVNDLVYDEVANHMTNR